MNAALKTKYGEDVKDQTVTVCSGLDFVNISLCHFVFEDQETAEVSLVNTQVEKKNRYRYD